MKSTRKFPRLVGLMAVALAATSAYASTSYAKATSGASAVNYEDRSQALDLMARYGQYFDSGNGEAYASLFTEDGELEFPGENPDTPGKSVKGRKNLAAFATDLWQQ